MIQLSQAPPHRAGPRRRRHRRRRRARRRPVDDDDRHRGCGGDGAAVRRAVGSRLRDGARHRQRAGSGRGRARDQAAHARRRLHGAAHRRLSLQRPSAAHALSRLRARARQVPHQPRQRRHRPAARRAVRDHLQGRRRQRSGRSASASMAAPSTRSSSWRKMQENTDRSLGRTSEEIINECMVLSAVQSTELAHRVGLAQGPDHHLVQDLAAGAPDRDLSRAGATDRPAAAPRADRSGHGHEGAGVVGVGDGRAAAAKASATRSACR